MCRGIAGNAVNKQMLISRIGKYMESESIIVVAHGWRGRK